MALKNYQYEEKPESDYQYDIETQPKYQDYQPENIELLKIRELVFFSHLAFVSISTVIISFTLLALSLNPAIALLIAVVVSFGLLKAFQFYYDHKHSEANTYKQIRQATAQAELLEEENEADLDYSDLTLEESDQRLQTRDEFEPDYTNIEQFDAQQAE